MIDSTFGIDERYCLSDEEWERIKPLLPEAETQEGFWSAAQWMTAER